MEDHFNAYQLLIAQFRAAGGIMSETSVADALLRTWNETDHYKGIEKSIRLTSDLATISVEYIEAKFVVEAHDQEEKFAGAVNARALLASYHILSSNESPKIASSWLKEIPTWRRSR